MFRELNALLHVEKYNTVLAHRKESINGDFLKNYILAHTNIEVYAGIL